MNTPNTPISPQKTAPFIRWLILATLGFALGVALLAVGITGYFRLGRDAQSLRDSVMNSTPQNWEKTVELNVGGLTCGLARTVISWFKLEPEVHTALQAVRGAEVGVYHLPQSERLANGSAILAAADAKMTARGWDRLVGVIQKSQLVAVYVPRQVRSANAVRFCLVTLKDRDLVVASARGNLEPLLELAGVFPVLNLPFIPAPDQYLSGLLGLRAGKFADWAQAAQ